MRKRISFLKIEKLELRSLGNLATTQLESGRIDTDLPDSKALAFFFFRFATLPLL